MIPRTAAVLLLCASLASAREPVRVIFDTDMGNDIDDALALAVLHALESRGEAKLLAVTLTKDNRFAAPYVDLVNTFYGRGHIPVGVVRNGKTPEDAAMIRVPCDRKRPDGTLLYPRRIVDGAEAPEAVALLRRVLAEQPDQSVVFVQVGFSTNLARLLEADRGLVTRKARLLSIMAGQFPAGNPEYNVKTDIPAAKKVFGEWPSPVSPAVSRSDRRFCIRPRVSKRTSPTSSTTPWRTPTAPTRKCRMTGRPGT
jgi:inosine-uridine nucleoside N-ribohydrolase